MIFSGDRPKSETKNRTMQRLEDSHVKSFQLKEKIGLHSLNTFEKISVATLTLQKACMKVEINQTKLLSLATQENSIKSCIELARHLALLACPEFDKTTSIGKIDKFNV